ncbi:unnamed protein product [Mucor hiemalis]
MALNQQHYNHTAENIPLGKVSTFDDEQKIYYQQQTEVYQSQNNNRDSVNSIYQVKQSKFSLFAQPLLSVLLSAFFSIALLLLFLYADGKPLDHTLVGMKIPSLVSLLLSINAIFLASGISKAVAEYKWVKLQNGAPLTMIDIYDACTRGLSGFFMTLRALQFDIVLIVALIFHIGLLVVSPVSQSILVPVQNKMNISNSDVVFHYMPADSTLGRTKLGQSGQAPKMNGLENNGYISSSSFTQASMGVKGLPIFSCPNNAVSCVYPNVTFITTTMSCHNVTSEEKALVYHNDTNNVVVLREYLTNDNVTRGSTVGSFPKFFYSADMLGRTSYELDNYKAPLFPGLNTTLEYSDLKKYDPQYRPYVGNQTFVMAYNTLRPQSNYGSNYTELSFRTCSLQSSMNVSDWKTENGTLVKTGVEISNPINFDFDNVLGNNLALNNISSNANTSTMVVAYLMQQTILSELIRPKYSKMYEYLYIYSTRYNSNMSLTKSSRGDGLRIDLFEEFMVEALASFDYALLQSPTVSADSQNTREKFTQGVAYFNLAPEYRVEKAAAYILCICLLIPIVWWLIIWLYSLKKNNGIARANSQIVLLATNMTPDAERNLRGFSGLMVVMHLNEPRMFESVWVLSNNRP